MDPHMIIKILSYLIAFLLACQLIDAIFEVDIIGGISTLLKALWNKIKPKEDEDMRQDQRVYDTPIKDKIKKDNEYRFDDYIRGARQTADKDHPRDPESSKIYIIDPLFGLNIKEEKEIIDVEFVEIKEEE